MLQLILGRAGTGKTAMVIEKIHGRVAHCEGKNIFLVPEQYSHEAERELLRRCGDTTPLYAEVLSFTRLAHMLARELGGSAREYADGAGRTLQMAVALERCAASLRVYGGARQKPETIASLLAALDELRYGCITPEQLCSAAEKADGELADKLRDLALLQTAMTVLGSESGADPLTRLDRLAEDIPHSAMLRGGAVFIDGFTDFTVQERRIIRELWLVGDVTVCLSCDDLHDGGEEFSLARLTARRLRDEAEGDGVAVRILTVPPKQESAPMVFLEENLFSYTGEAFDAGGSVSLHTAPTFSAECELAAAEVLRLVRETGCRWRDVAVAVRGFDTARGTLAAAFTRYGIPLYCTERTDILTKPLPALILSAYAVISGGWSYEDMFTYLKTGLAGLSCDELDELENYVLLWELRGHAWTDGRPWRQHPEGYNKDFNDRANARLDTINALRKRAAEPLAHFAAASKAAQTAREHCAALCGLFAELHLPERLDARAAELRLHGETQLADETLQLWEKISRALEQTARILGDTPMEQERFGRLFRLVLSQIDIGTIPVAVDRVTAGDFDRMRRRRLKHLLILSADDDHLPHIETTPGLFTAPERDALRALELNMENGDDRLDREFSLIYSVVTLPSETLYLSRALLSPDGSETRPSFLTERCAKLFSLREETGDLTAARSCAALPAFELAAAGSAEAAEALGGESERLERLRSAAALSRGRLSSTGVRALYGQEPYLTASRIDTFASCKFQYFLRYGLRAKPREAAGFDPPELGTFLHYILENVARECGGRGGFASVTDDEVRTLCGQYTARYVRERLEDFREKSARFVYLFRRLRETVERVVLDTAQELRRSDFTPLDFELNFSQTEDVPPVRIGEGDTSLVLTGTADRVDGWEHDGKIYLRVVDYKTGTKKFSLGDVWVGMGLQMLLYLFALEKSGSAHYGGREIIPAGVLYVPARDVLYHAQSRPSGEEILAEKLKATRRSGLILSDGDVLNAMEHSGDGFDYLPVKINRAGELTGDALATAQQLGELSGYIGELLEKMACELRRGSITADPWCRSETESTCLWCSYFDACHFDEKTDEPRFQPSLKAPEFWSRLEGRDNTCR